MGEDPPARASIKAHHTALHSPASLKPEYDELHDDTVPQILLHSHPVFLFKFKTEMFYSYVRVSVEEAVRMCVCEGVGCV